MAEKLEGDLDFLKQMVEEDRVTARQMDSAALAYVTVMAQYSLDPDLLNMFAKAHNCLVDTRKLPNQRFNDQEMANPSVDPVQYAIFGEIYRSLVLLGADFGLLGTIGSFGDSLSDDQVLAGLRAWNERMITEVKARIEHHEISCPRLSDTQGAAQETAR